jgi:hypothetical protein
LDDRRPFYPSWDPVPENPLLASSALLEQGELVLPMA